MRYLYVISGFYKYLFGLIVTAYVITVIGIPVYFHYCGGELEKIDYVMKSSGCCGDEDEDEGNGCCSDEGKLLVNNQDFTIKHNERLAAANSISDVTLFTPPYIFSILSAPSVSTQKKFDHLPPPLIHRATSITVLRI